MLNVLLIMLVVLLIELELHAKQDNQHVLCILLLIVLEPQQLNVLEQVILELVLQYQHQQHVLQYL